MFTLTDFKAFSYPTLGDRLAVIRRDLDPKFVLAGEQLVALATAAGLPKQIVHIAKHARRHKNPPPDTWLALATNPRGYKMMPHIELGLWDDRLFLWLAVLKESKPLTLDPEALAGLSSALPAGMELAGDHTDKLAAVALTPTALAAQTERFNQVQKAEWLIGKTYPVADPLWQTPAALWTDIQQRFTALLPLYQALSRQYADRER